ncbi:MAG TPA: ABC transporter permease subunit, partial [Gammaproteobacteria bacterium]|nr:ABC transporter permease subunit [Gammaproteobacteria bacterium]
MKTRGRGEMHGTLLIARLTWLETRRRRIALAALICGLLFLAVFGTAMYFGFDIAEMEGAAGIEMRIAATILTVAGLYVVNFLVTAVAILLPIDSLSGEIGSGVIQTLASKPVDRAAIVVGKWLAYLLMTAAYLALMAGGIFLIMRVFADYTAP